MVPRKSGSVFAPSKAWKARTSITEGSSPETVPEIFAFGGPASAAFAEGAPTSDPSRASRIMRATPITGIRRVGEEVKLSDLRCTRSPFMRVTVARIIGVIDRDAGGRGGAIGVQSDGASFFAAAVRGGFGSTKRASPGRR